MVTKLVSEELTRSFCYILAKNHMVTKQGDDTPETLPSYILAKNHMVTKHAYITSLLTFSYILAKNHMVTKQQWE